MPNLIRILPDNPDTSTLKAVSRRLLRGEVCILPTDTIYGFHCRADNDQGVSRIQALKERQDPKPLVMLIPGLRFLEETGFVIPDQARCLMERFWPGPLTLILAAPSGISRRVTGDLDSVAVRHPGYPILNRILEQTGVPLVSTSVNRSGEDSLLDIETIVAEFGSRVDCVLDAGPPPHTRPSTLVTFTETPPRILREGAIPGSFIDHVIC